jgi:hypothetical protein
MQKLELGHDRVLRSLLPGAVLEVQVGMPAVGSVVVYTVSEVVLLRPMQKLLLAHEIKLEDPPTELP